MNKYFLQKTGVIGQGD